jgi:BioD-like phosphotransacetylase family protein
MVNLSLKLDEEVFSEVERNLKFLKISRNAYINEALNFFNKLNKKKEIRQLIKEDIKKLGNADMEVLNDFEVLEDEIDG